jgi:aminoglycoside phosphotransferase (APT) family kinase protein
LRALLRLEPCLERRTLIAFRSAFDECAQALDGWEGPFVYAHGDFKSDNVRIGRAGLFVHDWAHARSGANPLADLLHFQLAPRTGWDAPLTTGALRRALRVAAHSAAQIHPEWSWPTRVVSALGLAYLVEALVERCLERHCFDPADPLIRAYWVLIERRAVWFPIPRPAFQRILRGFHYGFVRSSRQKEG